MFSLVYIFLIAKPISIRRLFLLFVLGLMSATGILEIVHVQHSTTYALAIAASVVALAWALPLVRIVQDTIRLRMLSLDALVPVSAVVQWTYGFALVTVPLIAIGYLLDLLLHYRALTRVPDLVVIAGLVALLLQLRLHSNGVQDMRRSPPRAQSATKGQPRGADRVKHAYPPARRIHSKVANRRYCWPR